MHHGPRLTRLRLVLCKGEEARTLLLAHKRVVYTDHAIDITLHVLGGILHVHRKVNGRTYRSWYATLDAATRGFQVWVEYLEASPHWVTTEHYQGNDTYPTHHTYPRRADPRRGNRVFDSPNP